MTYKQETIKPYAREGSKGEQLIAELSFIRGFLTLQATMLWGRVPIEDGTGNYSRRSLKEVWQFIIDNFHYDQLIEETSKRTKWIHISFNKEKERMQYIKLKV